MQRIFHLLLIFVRKIGHIYFVNQLNKISTV
jgi:hypothetical protein